MGHLEEKCSNEEWRRYVYVSTGKREKTMQSRKDAKNVLFGRGGEGHIGDVWCCYWCGGKSHLGDNCPVNASVTMTRRTAFGKYSSHIGPFNSVKINEKFAFDNSDDDQQNSRVPSPTKAKDIISAANFIYVSESRIYAHISGL
ncbi:hypothetical protein M422DRAFT_43360 [Sphaerobolus stellatus SS14]|nr:hypothetical protein M422DRAFT_43360 [Sphaerobolus stellatus SS14]